MPERDVTVVIPVWDDYVRWLPDALASVRAQDASAEVIVVDNASATALPALEGISMVQAPQRLSAGGARNLGLDAVTTEYVLVLDADDTLLEGALAFMRSRLTADSALSVAATSILDGATGERHRTPRPFASSLARRRRLFALADCVWSLYPIHGCAMFRTDDARQAGGYPDADWGDDWVLAVSLAFRGRVEVSERLGRFYRPTGGSLWRRPRAARELARSAELVRRRLRSDPAVPGWARVLLPLIAALQLAAVYVVRPAYLLFRRAPSAPPSNQGPRGVDE